MSDKISKTDDNLPAWSIRGVPADVRGATLTHAKKAGVSIGDYVTQAIREKIKADRSGGRAVAVRGPVSMSEAGQIVEMLKGLASAGVELPASLQKSAVSMLRKVTVEVSKGQAVSSSSQTIKPKGQTEGEESQTD